MVVIASLIVKLLKEERREKECLKKGERRGVSRNVKVYIPILCVGPMIAVGVTIDLHYLRRCYYCSYK